MSRREKRAGALSGQDADEDDDDDMYQGTFGRRRANSSASLVTPTPPVDTEQNMEFVWKTMMHKLEYILKEAPPQPHIREDQFWLFLRLLAVDGVTTAKDFDGVLKTEEARHYYHLIVCACI